MPSTYSTSLRLELMGSGEQAANWGNTTNYNLGTLLEQAIAGVENVTISGTSYTLTTGSGVADQARNAVINLIGTLTANCNVIVPSVDKVYTIRNSTTGGFSVVVKTAAGSGVTVANGNTQSMYCDATNVVAASMPFNATNGNFSVAGAFSVVGTSTLTGNVTAVGDVAVGGALTQGGGLVMPTGAMLEYAGSAAPTGWLLCNGAAISRTVYAALFAVLGTAYGAGDGSTTFNLPDRRGKFSVGVDGTYTRGSTGGATSGTTSSNGSHNHGGNTGSTTLTTAQIPAHNHSVNDSGHQHWSGVNNGGGGDYYGASTPANRTNNPSARYSLLGGITSDTSHLTSFSNSGISINNTGGGGGHDHTISSDGAHTHTVATVPPYLASNFIIKT
jgi:microcystin-dependent protein